MNSDQALMNVALALARRGLGTTWPNPTVGCVVANGGHVVGRGWTQPGGRPHAETVALAQAGAAARGGCAYVSLEPCAHWGQTPPCVNALISAGVQRAVIAMVDPDSRVGGRGIGKLRDAGIDIVVGTGEKQAREINRGFVLRIEQQRPAFTLKLATTLDGRIATASGESRWITGSPSRARTHLLRRMHDAVLIGSETALRDDPELTCRLPGHDQARQPVRVVVDARLRVPVASKLVRSASRHPIWIVTRCAADEERAQTLTAAGARVLRVEPDASGRLSPHTVARRLANEGLTRVLIEGGARVAASFLDAGLIDAIAWFHAPKIIGGSGIASVADLDAERLARVPVFRLTETRRCGADTLSTYTL